MESFDKDYKDSMYRKLLEKNIFNLEEPAMIYCGKRISYADLLENIEKCAMRLNDKGMGEGDIISIVSSPIPEVIYLIYAANKLGITVNIVNPEKNTEEIVERIKAENNFAIFISDDYITRLMPGMKAARIPFFVLSKTHSLTNKKTASNEFTYDGITVHMDCIKDRKEAADLCAIQGYNVSKPKKKIKLRNFDINNPDEGFIGYKEIIKPGKKVLTSLPLTTPTSIDLYHQLLISGTTLVLEPNLSVLDYKRYIIEKDIDFYIGALSTYSILNNTIDNKKMLKILEGSHWLDLYTYPISYEQQIALAINNERVNKNTRKLTR